MKALEHPFGEWCLLGRAETSMKGEKRNSGAMFELVHAWMNLR
jgi:hypothetical protein